MFYDSYKEAPGLLDGKQKKYDVVVFACAEAYRFTASRLKAEIPWFYVPVTDASLYRGLLLAQRTGWDLGRLSFDTYEESVLREVYDELKYPEKKLHIKCYLGVSRILCKLKNAVQIEQIYSKGAARKSAVPFAVILAVNLPYVKDQ